MRVWLYRPNVGFFTTQACTNPLPRKREVVYSARYNIARAAIWRDIASRLEMRPSWMTRWTVGWSWNVSLVISLRRLVVLLWRHPMRPSEMSWVLSHPQAPAQKAEENIPGGVEMSRT